MKIYTGFKFTAAVIALGWAGLATAETLTNDDVVALLEAGLGEEAVIAKVETSDGDFVVDTQTLLALRAKGVPSKVIAAMVKVNNGTVKFDDTSPDPTVAHSPRVLHVGRVFRSGQDGESRSDCFHTNQDRRHSWIRLHRRDRIRKP